MLGFSNHLNPPPSSSHASTTTFKCNAHISKSNQQQLHRTKPQLTFFFFNNTFNLDDHNTKEKICRYFSIITTLNEAHYFLFLQHEYLVSLNCSLTVPQHNGPHLRNECTTEKWAYGRFNAKLGIYQYGREQWLRSNLTSGLSSCTQVFFFLFFFLA